MRRKKARPNLLNDLVGDGEQLVRNFQTERLRSDQIDGEIEFGRLLDGDVGRLRPAQNLVAPDCRASSAVVRQAPTY